MLQAAEVLFQCKGAPVVGAQQFESAQSAQNRQIVNRDEGPVGRDEFTVDVVDIHNGQFARRMVDGRNARFSNRKPLSARLPYQEAGAFAIAGALALATR